MNVWFLQFVRRSDVLLPVLALVLIFSAAQGVACDYTVRDIGFVPLETPRYSLIVVGAKRHELDDATLELASRWGLRALCVGRSNISDLPDGIKQHATSNFGNTTVWLVDDQRRTLLLDERADAPATISLVSMLNEQFDTPYNKQLRQGATKSFAQIVLFDGEPSMVDEARKAAAALKQIEPMLPRPISLPAQVIVVPKEAREAERVFLWSLGVDDLEAADSTMSVVYGRGRLAGKAMVGVGITHADIVAQLALVGESCECETDRDWLDERVLPLYWDDDHDRIASGILGFNPGNPQVQAEVKRVIARGKRQSATRNSDTIERIVASYMESQLAGYVPPRLTIPPGAGPFEKSSADRRVNATVIQGDGWSFDEDEQTSEPEEKQEAEAMSGSVVFRPQESEVFAADGVPAVQDQSESSVAMWGFGLAVLFACFAIWRAAKANSARTRDANTL